MLLYLPWSSASVGNSEVIRRSENVEGTRLTLLRVATVMSSAYVLRNISAAVNKFHHYLKITVW